MITAVPTPLPVDVAWDTGRGVRVPRDPRPVVPDAEKAVCFLKESEAVDFIDRLCEGRMGRCMLWPKTREDFSIKADNVPDGPHWVCVLGMTPNDRVLLGNFAHMWGGGKLHQVLNS